MITFVKNIKSCNLQL